MKKLNYLDLNMMTKSTGIGYSCLNQNCKSFISNPSIENAIKKGKFVAGIYNYYTPENNTVWSTDCYLCLDCTLPLPLLPLRARI